jgi:uncharacterized protein involved in outer membrane biogenesis
MKHKALMTSAALVTTLLAVVLALPVLIDWSSIKAKVVAKAEAATGRKVEIAGKLRLRLLPSPAVTAERISIANLAGAEPAHLATAQSLRLRLKLLPLLGGRVEVASLDLDKPVLELERLADGRANWNFTPTAKPAEQPPAPTSTAPTPGGSPTAASDHPLRLASITITDGTLVYRSGDAKPLVVEALSGRVDLGEPTAATPFAAKGSLRLMGSTLAFDASAAAPQPGQSAPLRAAITLPGADTALDLNGTMGQDAAGHPTIQAALRLHAASLRRTVAALGGPQSLPPVPVAMDGQLSYGGDEAALQNLTLALGESQASGSIVAALGVQPIQIDASMRAASIDLDRMLASSPPATDGARPAAPASAPSAPSAAPASAPTVLPSFALPKGVAANLDLAVETLAWHGAAIRQIQLNALLDDGTMTLSRASAQLPGGASIALSGTLASHDGTASFDGTMKAAAESLRGVLDWLKLDVAAVPDGRLKHFAVDAKLAAEGNEVRVSDLTLSLDATGARGALTVRLGERPAFGLSLGADAVDVDSYRPAPKPARVTAQPVEVVPASPAPAQSSASTAAAPPAWLGSFDANVRLRLGQMVLNEVSATGLAFDATLANGDLSLQEASVANLAGASAKAGGTVLGLGGTSPRLQQMGFDIRAPQPARLLRFLGLSGPEKLGPLTLAGSLDGDWNAIAVKANLASGGVDLASVGTLTSPMQAPRYAGSLSGHAASFGSVVRLFSADYRPKGGGAFTLAATVTGDAAGIHIANLETKAGEAALSGQVHVALGGGRPLVTADLSGNAIALDPFLSAERTGLLLPLPGGLHGAGGTVPAPASSLVAAAMTPDGGHWSHSPLDLSALHAVDARISLNAKAVSMQGWRLDGATTQINVANGIAQVEKLSGRLLDGQLSANAKLGGAPVATLSGAFTITGANIKDAKLGAGDLKVSQGRMDADAKWSASGRSPFDLVSALNGDGHLAVHDGRLDGFDLTGVNSRLQNIENIGSLVGLMQGGLTGGSTRFSALTASFRAEGGVITCHDLKLDAEGGGATGEATINLPRYTIDSHTDFRLANASAPPLVLKLEGPLENPRKIIDVNALQRYLVERGLGRALGNKGGGGNFMDMLTGRKPNPAPADPSQPQPQQQAEKPPKPADVLRNLFKGLGK